MIQVMVASARFQLQTLRSTPADLTALITAPLYAVAFLSIVRYTGRSDLDAYVVLGPAVMAVLQMALVVSGQIVDSERANGTMEAVIAAPAPMAVMVFGRVVAVTVISMFAVLESWFVARFLFHVAIRVQHPALLVVTLACGGVAMIATGTAMAAVFVLARSARTFQNALSYPLFLLGGAVVPPALLPDWLRPLSKIVFLSWTTDLIRACLSASPVVGALPRLLVVVALGALAGLVGVLVLNRVLDRVRATGTVAHA